jgi:uncharacterized OB-fold protein
VIWSKKATSTFPPHVEGSEEVERYVYTPGFAGEQLAKGLVKGVFVAEKCGDELWFPPRGFCPDLSRPDKYVEISGDTPWKVISYTVVRRDSNGNPLPEPIVMVYVTLEGTKGGLIHRLKPGVKPSIGMKVKAVFKAEKERKGTIEDILYFEPI